MPSSQNKWDLLRELIILSLEGSISQEQSSALRELIRSDPELRTYYLDYMTIHCGLFRITHELTGDSCEYEINKLNRAFKALAGEEKTAPTARIEEEKEIGTFVENIEQKQEVLKGKKYSLVSLIVSAAALVFLVLFAKFNSVDTGIEVATLTDSIKTRWSDSTGSIPPGSRLVTGYTPLVLQEGIVELRFDNAARVVIEAPAQFCLLTEDQIKLNYGKLYAVVPQMAIGFSVNTPNSRIIDLGTEFGIQAGPDGSTELHVIKGKINLLAGIINKTSMEVRQGNAKRVSGNTSQVIDIPVKEMAFARSISSENDAVWRGQKQIDLADIVGGGDGFGTGQFDKGIDPLTGKPSAALTYNQSSPNTYRPSSASPYIDGVFIPNGRSKQIISSQGHIFKECPISSGGWYINILNTIRILDPQTTPDLTISGSPAAHCVLMHANMGVTYDLEAMRSRLPQANIVRFQSKFGIGQEMKRPCNADFWILVDGNVRYKKQVNEKTLFPADIELSEKDRFLTLVTTDGQDPEGRIFNNTPVTPYDSDWCFFADPVLILE